MNKKWDYEVPSVEFWKEVYRVLKPGGHICSFGGTRTYHRMVVNCEDAGFEVRDCISWLYGSGFPKSLNISKLLEKNKQKKWNTKIENVSNVEKNLFQKKINMDGQDFVQGNVLAKVNGKQQIEFVKIVENYSTFLHLISSEQIDHQEYFVLINAKENIRNQNLQVQQILIGEVEFSPERMVILQCQLEIVNTDYNTILLWKSILEENFIQMNKCITSMELKMIIDLKILNYIQYQATHDFIPIQGIEKMGTSLKPAVELILLARKPLSEPTIAENVLRWGTGGLNIDDSRIETTEEDLKGMFREKGTDIKGKSIVGASGHYTPPPPNEQGRFPANIILDEEAAEVLDEQSGISKSVKHEGYLPNGPFTSDNKEERTQRWFNDQGGASRYFKIIQADSFQYIAKVSKKERNLGCEGLEKKNTDNTNQGWKCSNCNKYHGDICKCEEPNWIKPQNGNFHPTLKPIKLMSYLIKLITPPNGIVLDPFMGSGSTGIAAALNNFNFIGMELEPDYMNIAEARISHWEEYKKIIK